MTPDPQRRRFLHAAAGVGTWPWLDACAPMPPAERVIDVVARKFEFIPEEIRLHVGESATLRFTAPDVPMGFSLADFKIRADIVPGRTTTIRLRPDRTGRFIFACDVFCGGGHEEMGGVLIVTEG
jgi:cytochrome c oxidase subunit II